MSHWNHRVFKYVHPEGDEEYTVREVYYDDDGKPELYSAEPQPPCGPTLEDLIVELGRMQVACAKPILTEADFSPPPLDD